MGEAKNWRKRFFADHPRCCFCAGEAETAEPDHQPGRAFFKDNEWPEGFVFPSCVPCNRASRTAENALSLVTSHFPDSEGHPHYLKRIQWMWQNQPEVMESLRMSANEKRSAAKKFGLEPAEGEGFSQISMIKFPLPIWRPLLMIFARKLMLALHYQALTRPLPRSGGIWLGIATNLDVHVGHPLTEIHQMAERLVRPVRQNKYLDDQLSIRWDASAELGAGIFNVALQKRFVFSGLTIEDPAILGSSFSESMLGPLSHDGLVSMV